MSNLSIELLIETYNKAIEMNLSQEFIMLLDSEINNRLAKE